MELYCINDLHIDSHIKQAANIRTVSTPKYKKFLADNTLPADVLMIGGDISHSLIGVVSLLVAAARMFNKVIWVPGNSEYRCWNAEANLSTFEKLAKIDSFVKTLTKSGQVIRLDGNTTQLDNLVVGGGIGMADVKWFAKNDEEYSQEKAQSVWESSPYRFWHLSNNNFENISNTEIDRVLKLKEKTPDYVMTHFAPSNLFKITDKYPNLQSKAEKHFLAFDAKKLTDTLKDGAVYHFGHAHIKLKQTVKNKNGEFLLINNSIGRKTDLVDNPRHLTKQDFLLTF